MNTKESEQRFTTKDFYKGDSFSALPSSIITLPELFADGIEWMKRGGWNNTRKGRDITLNDLFPPLKVNKR